MSRPHSYSHSSSAAEEKRASEPVKSSDFDELLSFDSSHSHSHSQPQNSSIPLFDSARLSNSLLFDDRTLHRMKSLTAEIRHLKLDAHKKESSIAAAQRKIEELNKQLAEKNESLANSASKLSELHRLNEKSRFESRLLNEKLSKSHQQQAEMENEMKQRENDFQLREREFYLALAELETKFSTARAEVDRKEILRQKAEFELAIAIADAKRAHEMANSAENERIRVEEKVEYKLHEFQKSCSARDEQVESLESDNNYLAKQLKESQEQINSLNAEIQEFQATKAIQFDSLAAQRKEITELQNERFHLRRAADLIPQLKQRADKASELESAQEDWADERDRLRYSLTSSSERCEFVSLECENLKSKIFHLESELAAARGRLERGKFEEEIRREEKTIQTMEVERHQKTVEVQRAEILRLDSDQQAELKQIAAIVNNLNYAIKLVTVVAPRGSSDSDSESVSLESVINSASLSSISSNVRSSFQSLHESLLLLSVECDQFRRQNREFESVKAELGRVEDSFAQMRVNGKQLEIELEQMKLDEKKRDEELIHRIKNFTNFLDSLSSLSFQFQPRSESFSLDSLQNSFNSSLSSGRFQDFNSPVDWIFITASIDRIMAEIRQTFQLLKESNDELMEENELLKANSQESIAEFNNEISSLKQASEKSAFELAELQANFDVTRHSHEMAERAARLLFRALIPTMNRLNELRAQKLWLSRQYNQAEAIKLEIRALKFAINGESTNQRISGGSGIRKRKPTFRSAAIAVIAFNRLVRFLDEKRSFGRGVQVFSEQFYILSESFVNDAADLTVEDSNFTRSAASLFKLIKAMSRENPDSHQFKQNLISDLSAGFYKFYSDKPIKHAITFNEERDDLSAIRRIAIQLANSAHKTESENKSALEFTKLIRNLEVKSKQAERALESVSAELSESNKTINKLRDESASQSSAIQRQQQTIEFQSAELSRAESNRNEIRETREKNNELQARLREMEFELSTAQQQQQSNSEVNSNHSSRRDSFNDNHSHRNQKYSSSSISSDTGIIRPTPIPYLMSPQPGVARSKTKKLTTNPTRTGNGNAVVAVKKSGEIVKTGNSSLIKATPLSSDRSITVNDGIIHIRHHKGGHLSVELDRAKLKDAKLIGGESEENNSINSFIKAANENYSQNNNNNTYHDATIDRSSNYRPAVQRQFDNVDSIDLKLNLNNGNFTNNGIGR